MKASMHKPFAMILAGLLVVSAARAADVSGQWRAGFDTQIGLQKCFHAFQADGEV